MSLVTKYHKENYFLVVFLEAVFDDNSMKIEKNSWKNHWTIFFLCHILSSNNLSWYNWKI